MPRSGLLPGILARLVRCTREHVRWRIERQRRLVALLEREPPSVGRALTAAIEVPGVRFNDDGIDTGFDAALDREIRGALRDCITRSDSRSVRAIEIHVDLWPGEPGQIHAGIGVRANPGHSSAGTIECGWFGDVFERLVKPRIN